MLSLQTTSKLLSCVSTWPCPRLESSVLRDRTNNDAVDSRECQNTRLVFMSLNNFNASKFRDKSRGVSLKR